MGQIVAQSNAVSPPTGLFIAAIALALFVVWVVGRARFDAPNLVAQSAARQPAREQAAAAAQAGPAPTDAQAPEKAALVAPDELRRIEGIGPKIASVLQAAGISTFAALAATPAAEIQRILDQAGIARISDPTTWPEQARLAAAGEWAALQALQESLVAGRRAS